MRRNSRNNTVFFTGDVIFSGGFSRLHLQLRVNNYCSNPDVMEGRRSVGVQYSTETDSVLRPAAR
jgi:hypothetical protein